MEGIDITLRHLDLRQLRLGEDDDTVAGSRPRSDSEAPVVSHEPDDAEEDEVVIDLSQEYTTPWQLPAKVS